MAGKQHQVRRGGLHGARANSHNTIARGEVPSSNGTRVQETNTLSSTTETVRRQAESSQQQQQSSSQEQHRVSSSSASQQDLAEQEDSLEDPPSGEDLPSEYWGPLDTPGTEDDLLDSDELMDPGAAKGRSITVAPKAQKKKALRINVTVDANGVFVGKAADKVIAHHLKYFFNPNYKTWESVPKSHRELLFKEFRMACRWDPELQELIVKQWIRVNRKKYNDMMHKAKNSSQNGIRPKWMQVRHYFMCVEYWKSPDFVKISDRNKKNRGVGVNFNEAGEALPPKPTHTGGQNSIVELGDSLEAYIETKQKGKRKVGESNSLEQDVEGLEEEVVVPQGNSSEVEWIDDGYRVIVEDYNKNLDELFKDNPQDRPSNSDPRNPVAWAKAVGGPNRGNIPGVSNAVDPRLLGYPISKRQAQHVPNNQKITQDMAKITEEREKITEEREKITEEREKITEERKKMVEEMEKFNSEKAQFAANLWKQFEHKMEQLTKK